MIEIRFQQISPFIRGSMLARLRSPRRSLLATPPALWDICVRLVCRNLDLGIHKDWYGRQLRIEYRAEDVQLLEPRKPVRPEWLPWPMLRDSGAIGAITSALPERSIQMALKLIW